jgi:hypothetical protein
MKLRAKHIIFTILVELSILFCLPYISTQSFIFSTNATVPLTYASLLLLMLAHTQGQMKADATMTYRAWEVINILRKYILIVFCTNAEFCNSVITFMVLFTTLCDKLLGKQVVLVDCFFRSTSSVFACLVVLRVMLQGRAAVLLWGLLQWIFLQELSEVSYMTQQIYLPWVLITMN